MASTLGGALVTTVQNGAWSDPATWDLGVPDGDLSDQPRINHAVTVTTLGNSGGDTNIGRVAPGSLSVSAGSLALCSIIVGTDVSGSMDVSGGAVTACELRVGFNAGGVLELRGGSLDASELQVGSASGGGSGDVVVEGAGASVTVMGEVRIGSVGRLVLRPTANGPSGLSQIATNNVNFLAGSTIELDTSSYVPLVGDSWEFIAYSGTHFGSPTNLVAPPGFAIAYDTTTPGVARITVTAATLGAPFCFGVGCPCGNDSATSGCVNSTGSGAVLAGSGSTSVAADDLVLTTTGCPPNNTGLYFMGASTFDPIFVGDGLGCTGGLFRYFPGMVDGSGDFDQLNPVANAPAGLIQPGDTRHFQSWTRDVLCGPPPAPCPSPCGNNSNLSNGYSITFTP